MPLMRMRRTDRSTFRGRTSARSGALWMLCAAFLATLYWTGIAQAQRDQIDTKRIVDSFFAYLSVPVDREDDGLARQVPGQARQETWTLQWPGDARPRRVTLAVSARWDTVGDRQAIAFTIAHRDGQGDVLPSGWTAKTVSISGHWLERRRTFLDLQVKLGGLAIAANGATLSADEFAVALSGPPGKANLTATMRELRSQSEASRDKRPAVAHRLEIDTGRLQISAQGVDDYRIGIAIASLLTGGRDILGGGELGSPRDGAGGNRLTVDALADSVEVGFDAEGVKQFIGDKRVLDLQRARAASSFTDLRGTDGRRQGSTRPPARVSAQAILEPLHLDNLGGFSLLGLTPSRIVMDMHLERLSGVRLWQLLSTTVLAAAVTDDWMQDRLETMKDTATTEFLEHLERSGSQGGIDGMVIEFARRGGLKGDAKIVVAGNARFGRARPGEVVQQARIEVHGVEPLRAYLETVADSQPGRSETIKDFQNFLEIGEPRVTKDGTAVLLYQVETTVEGRVIVNGIDQSPPGRS